MDVTRLGWVQDNSDILAESESVIAVPEGPIYIDSYDDDGGDDGSGGSCDITDRPFPAFDRYP